MTAVGSSMPRGNLTTEKRCKTINSTQPVTSATAASACSAWLLTTHTYDLTGQVLSATDPNLNTTSFFYTDSYASGTPPGRTNGYVTSIVYPLGYTSSYSYYYESGQIASQLDANGQTTSYAYSDPGKLNRLTLATRPDKGTTGIAYHDTSPPSITVTSTSGSTSPSIVHTTLYDGLGRVVQTQLTSDPAGTDYVGTTYDSNGRVYSVSNPHRSSSSPTDGITYFTTYDGSNRLTLKTNPDASTVSYTYAGNTVTFTDENQNQWGRTSNGLGQLFKVLEPNGSSKTPVNQTDYTYDPLDNLLSVKQWGGPSGSPPANGPIQRTFAYNAVSWLLGASKPETASATMPPSRTVNPASETLYWTTPAAINYGTALSSTQLNATSGGIAGTFAYSPAAGTILSAGTHTLSVTFTPTDRVNYSVVSGSVSLVVNKVTPLLTLTYTPTTPPHTHTATFTCTAKYNGWPC
ncbi:MAG TPA: hypothetical protein VGG62_15695 [Terracidiphilus sp.]